MNERPAEPASRDPLLQRVDALILLLDEEHRRLCAGDSAELEQLAEQKLGQAQALDRAVREHGEPLPAELPTALGTLHRANARNAALLQVRQRYTRAALAEMRGDAPAPVYESAGKPPGGRSTRLIAQA